jgi:hypothetical protein
MAWLVGRDQMLKTPPITFEHLIRNWDKMAAIAEGAQNSPTVF